MRRALMLSALILSATRLSAHHNVAQMYDAEKPVALNGTITAVQWRNPHVFVFMDAKDEAGSVVNWKVEWLAAMIITVPGAFENYRIGLCKAVSR